MTKPLPPDVAASMVEVVRSALRGLPDPQPAFDPGSIDYRVPKTLDGALADAVQSIATAALSIPRPPTDADLYISRVNVASGADVVRIEARNGAKLLARIEVSIEGFARATLGIACIPAQFSTTRDRPGNSKATNNGDQVQD